MKFSGLLRGAAFAAGVTIVHGSVLSGETAWPAVVQRTTDGSSNGATVVAIGDSIMEGHGLAASEAWPALLAQEYGWRLTNLASDGSGFVTVGTNGDTFANQVQVAVRLHPSIVIVSGSSNDLGASSATIARSTDATITAIRAALPTAEILAVSPVWNDKTEPAQLNTIDSDVVQAAAAVGALTLEIGQPLYGQPALMQTDDVHPTAAGQKVIAAAVEKTLSTSTPSH